MAVSDDRPLVGVPSQENGREVVRYFAEDTTDDSPLPEAVLRRARAAYGSWRGLTWEETEEALNRIRDANPPTPPVDPEL